MTFNISLPVIRFHVKSRRQTVQPPADGKIGKYVAYVNRDGHAATGVIVGWQYDMVGELSYAARNADGMIDYISSWNFRGEVAQ